MTWTAIAVAAVVLDVDALPRIWGAGDIALLGGHRALTHSLAFALLMGILLAFGIGRRGFPRWRLAAVLAIAVATHAGLDALTSYGEGIQLLAPFSDARFRSSWQPLGGGIARDTAAFFMACLLARAILKRRRLPLPALLDPPFLRPPAGTAHD